ncbi:DUF418 domain-containing protein [Hymenobacter armeniacus]|uniref:DUF418 domain-containing protein n=1 Tax=Hymenobacter armeniacus TaxID=2771358 RepID=A0ABR8JRD9_9BACT|nr:DUF418 domain-containing protein [Hymenobacter armeniacus]MBD2722541.1 DUF418 domain-containing protein [Hymenobacter armeniacus]
MNSPVPLPAAPLAETNRAELLDALRGFALCGVCLANLFTGFAAWNEPGGPPAAQLPTAATDPAAAFLIRALVDGKFYSLFSLLFGVGFAVQLHSATARGDTQLLTYRRRLWVLLGIGLMHLLFVWPGDILAFYALVGLLLVRLRHLPDRAIGRWAAGLLLLPVPLWAVFWLGGGWQALVPLTPAAPFYAVAQALDRPLHITSFYQVVANSDWGFFWKAMRSGFFYRAGDLLFQWRICKVLAMFLLGLWVGRHQVFRQLDAYRPLLRRVALGGLALGLAANLLNAYLNHGREYNLGQAPGLWFAVLYALGVGPLALGYAATFALAWRRPGARLVLRQLAPLGRMALTCYLSQSLIGSFLFYGLGLGWAGKVGPTLLWHLAAGIVGSQLLFCRWWLQRYQFGPAEWLWRSLSYRRAQPLRRAAALAVTAAA